MAQGLGHMLGRRPVVVTSLESTDCRRKAAARRMMKAKRLRKQTTIAMHVKVLRDTPKDRFPRIASSNDSQDIRFASGKHPYSAVASTLAAAHIDVHLAALVLADLAAVQIAHFLAAQ